MTNLTLEVKIINFIMINKKNIVNYKRKSFDSSNMNKISTMCCIKCKIS